MENNKQTINVTNKVVKTFDSLSKIIILHQSKLTESTDEIFKKKFFLPVKEATSGFSS